MPKRDEEKEIHDLDEPDNFTVRLDPLLENLRFFFSAVVKFPGQAFLFTRQAAMILSSWSEFKSFVHKVWEKLRNTPLIVFYGYLWKNRKSHFFLNLFSSYAMPVIMESLPWYFSRYKIGRELRDIRNKIHNQMISGHILQFSTARKYTLLTMLYAILENIDRHINTRVALMNKLLVKRLVLERILFSEIWSFNEYHGRELEFRISNEIQTTLRLFSFTIPNMMSSIYAIFRESMDLYSRRSKIDWLSIVRPFVMIGIWKSVDWAKQQVMGTKTITTTVVNPHVTQLFSNVIDGLTDIQLNNLQPLQLRNYDYIVSREFSVKEDVRLFTNRVYSTFTKKSVFDFVTDHYIAALVMQRRGMNYEQYRKIQIDIDHLIKLVKQAGSYMLQIKRVIERSSRVVKLMQLPSFKDEDQVLPVYVRFSHFSHNSTVSNFDELKISNVAFSYSRRGRPPYALSFEEDLVFLPSKIYGIIGQNRSGKSTLVNLITKLYVPQRGSLTWNGIQYASIQRKSLRDVIAYVAQKPFIFPGTIADNIRMGNTTATEDDIINAADAAGIFLYDEFKQQQLKAQAALKDLVKKTTKKRLVSRLKSEERYNSAASDGEESSMRSGDTEFDEQVESPRIGHSADEKEIEEVESPRFADVPEELTQPIEIVEITPLAPEPEPEPEPLTEEQKQEKKKRSADKKRRRQLKILHGKTLARGSNLSGGFAQSVALARIFLKKEAKIVILDESMSAMDPIKKRQVIFPNLLKFAKERNLTLIMITHDMTNLELFDHMIMLENGRIVCQGKHEELMDSMNFKYLQMLGINLSSL